MGDCTTRRSTLDAALVCPTPPLPPTCLNAIAMRMYFLQMCFLGACCCLDVVVMCGGVDRHCAIEKRKNPRVAGWCPRAANFLPTVPRVAFLEGDEVSCIAMASRIINAVGLAVVKIDYRFTNTD